MCQQKKIANRVEKHSTHSRNRSKSSTFKQQLSFTTSIKKSSITSLASKPFSILFWPFSTATREKLTTVKNFFDMAMGVRHRRKMFECVHFIRLVLES
jgi:hypothetical protein